jgi:peroxiredoxin
MMACDPSRRQARSDLLATAGDFSRNFEFFKAVLHRSSRPRNKGCSMRKLSGQTLRGRRLQVVVLGAFVAVTFGFCPQSSASDSVGRKVAPFVLKDYRGKEHSLAALLREKKAVAIVFLGTECPLAKLYGPRMQALSKEFEAKGVAFIGIDSNRQDAVVEMDAFARQQGLTIPILKDLSNRVADDFGATRTPEAFLIDAQGVIRYQGRIDNQYTFGAGVGYAQPQLKRRDLAVAVDEVVAGKPVSVATTEAKGCIIGRVREPKKESAVSYSNQISRLLNQRCVYCHRTGEIGPFAMTKYDEVAGWGEMIAEVVREQRMPPWHANPAHGKFANENVLSEKEKELIYAWVDAGCPEGNPAELPPPPKFTEGWLLERAPDKVVYMNDKPVDIKAEGVDPYRYYVADPGFKEDKWVRSAQCLPSNPAVVHHIIVFIAPPQAVERMVEREKQIEADLAQNKNVDPQALRARRRAERIARAQAAKKQAAAKPAGPKDTKGKSGKGDATAGRGGGDGDIAGMDLLCGFAPGTRPFIAPPGMAKLVPAGWKFIFQMHYTPNGSPQKDRSAIGLLFDDPAKVTHRLTTTNTANVEFEIPAYAEDYKVESRKKFVRDTLFIGMYPHMHVRGKSFRYELTYPDGKKEILLDVPRYDFNWQNWFKLEKSLVIPAGSEMLCTAHFDNSENNLYNPDPTKPVRWGDQTWEEMMIGWYDAAFPKAEAAKLLREQQEADLKALQEQAQRIQKRYARQQQKQPQKAESSPKGEKQKPAG